MWVVLHLEELVHFVRVQDAVLISVAFLDEAQRIGVVSDMFVVAPHQTISILFRNYPGSSFIELRPCPPR